MNEILKNGLDSLRIPWDDDKIEQLVEYSKLLVEWNEKINLTAITNPSEIATKHFLDSATALCTGKVEGRVIDVGTGAGFPGLVLKILKPKIKLTLLDSLNKRLIFLEDVIQRLGIDGVELVHSRAEDGARRSELRERFDTAVSRAVAQLPLLSELCLPYVKQGGSFLALKGPAAEEEIHLARRAVTILGGAESEVFNTPVPGTDLEHKIIIIKKVRHTPIKFPRKPGLISKSPIETCYNLPKNPAK